jgi:hypothetical protein
MLALLNDRDQVMSGAIADLYAPGFTERDHRRLAFRPSDEVDQLGDDLRQYEELTGQWPRFSVPEVLAVRGDRLVAYRLTMKLGEMGVRELIMVQRFDEPVERGEVSHMFDPEDVDEALALLDRLHAELGAD